MHPDDPLHVILDALSALRCAICHGTQEPWADYDGDDADAKTTSDGYMAALVIATQGIEAELSKSDGWRIPQPDPA